MDGRPVWKHWLGDPLMSMPAVYIGRVYMIYPDSRAGGQHFLACFDLETGERHWRQPIAGEIITAPVVAEGHVYLGFKPWSVRTSAETHNRQKPTPRKRGYGLVFSEHEFRAGDTSTNVASLSIPGPDDGARQRFVSWRFRRRGSLGDSYSAAKPR